MTHLDTTVAETWTCIKAKNNTLFHKVDKKSSLLNCILTCRICFKSSIPINKTYLLPICCYRLQSNRFSFFLIVVKTCTWR